MNRFEPLTPAHFSRLEELGKTGFSQSIRDDLNAELIELCSVKNDALITKERKRAHKVFRKLIKDLKRIEENLNYAVQKNS